jgi:glycopeptide antibiotics resistance protein
MRGLERLFSARSLFVLSGLFIVYATTIPWDFAHAPHLGGIAWVPGWDPTRGRIWSVPDMVQNVVLFLPFGFFGVLANPRLASRGALLGALGMGLLGLLLSLFVEALQTMSATRTPSTTDLATNFLGAAIGGQAAILFQHRLRARVGEWLLATARERPGLLILIAYFLAITGGALAPFIPTLDVGALRASVRGFLDAPLGPKPLGALLTDGLLFGALAFLATHELPAALRRLRGLSLFSGGLPRAPVAAGLAFMASATLALGLECAQLFIIGHSPSLGDVGVAMVGAALGAGLAAVLSRGQPRPAARLGALTRRSPRVVLAFAVLAPVTRALAPFQLRPFAEGLAAASLGNLLPFWSLFSKLDVSTFRNVFEAAAIYLPLGYALAALQRPPWFAAAVAVGLAWTLELLQLGVVGRVSDITEGLYAALMALVGAWALGALGARPGPER